MNKSAVPTVIAESRNCVATMFENAEFIQREIAEVEMSEAHQMQTKKLCATLVWASHEITKELTELDKLIESESSLSLIESRMNGILKQVQDELVEMNELVTALESASKQDPGSMGAYILVAESARNILNAFTRTMASMGG